MSKTILNPPELFDSLQYGFSQIAVASGTRTVYLSGQVAWDAQRRIVGPGDLAAQVIQALKNVETALALVGARLDDVVSMRIYIKHTHMRDGKAVSDGLKRFFGEQPPCTTWIGVPALANEDFLVEIEPVAVVERP